jgi:hypothetical protein
MNWAEAFVVIVFLLCLPLIVMAALMVKDKKK